MKTDDKENKGSEHIIENEGFQVLTRGLIGVFTMIFLGLLIDFVGLPMLVFYIILGVGFALWLVFMIRWTRS
jgi:hypothetical protein